ncbi:MAG TPA: purine-nucleoside phosphorylase [Pirellulaceae bacterium]
MSFPLAAQVSDAAEHVRSVCARTPRVGLILGTGLGGFVDQIAVESALEYGDIPHFPRSTAMGHSGRWIHGTVGSVPLVAMQGRFHLYEGYSPWQITLPIRVMRELGATVLLVTNASGGLNPLYRSGDLMLMDDHINLMFANPLVGPNDDRWGPRFPDMSRPYDPALIERALAIARRRDILIHRGVYAALRGPTYETRAEYRMLRTLGADVVGMSTVPEVLVAVHAGMRVLGISVVTNICRPDQLAPTHGDEVIAAARGAATRLESLVRELLESPL